MDDGSYSERWDSLRALLGRSSKFGIETGPLTFMEGVGFEPDSEAQDMIAEAKVLCVGAGGLGCEIIKDLALTGFQNIHVIDLDTIDVTNLNRQFLFRKKDVGQPKATVAAAFVNDRVPGVKVTAHFGKLQDYGAEWYRDYNVVVAGLDNLEARRWLNQMLCSLVQYEESGALDATTVIPLIDGGTEGFKGQARVILPMITSCFECTMNMFPPAQTKAVCTLENNPRQPSDCAIYVFMKIDDDEATSSASASGAVVFSQNEQVMVCEEGSGASSQVAGIVVANESGGIAGGEDSSSSSGSSNAMETDGSSSNGGSATSSSSSSSSAASTYAVRVAGEALPRVGVPGHVLMNIRQQWVADFGADTKVDKDSRVHMTWIHERAAARADLFNIVGLTYDKTMGAVKNIIPAVASTNAVIAAACVHEAYKCLTFSGQLCNTYMLYNGQSMAGGVSCDTLKFERDPECMHCQDTKEKTVKVPASTTVAAFVESFVLQPGALDLTTVVDGVILPATVEPMVYDGEGLCFYCTTAPLAAMKASNLPKPLSELVDHGEVVSITDARWGKNVKRALKVAYV